MNRRVWRLIRVTAGLAAVGAVVWAIVRSWPVAREYLLPRPLIFAAVVLLSVIGSLGAAASWAWLSAERGHRVRPFVAFVASQPTKYLPLGGALQFATVVDLSTERGGRRSTLAAMFMLHAVVCISTALALGSFKAFAPGQDPIRRLVMASGALAWLLLLPSVRALLERASRRGPRVLHDALSRSSRRFASSFAWCVVPLVTGGTSLVLLLQPVPQWIDVITIVPAWIAAWVVGFVALPFPSGAGVRELVLAFLLPAQPLPAILAASLAHRTAILGAELLLLAATWRRAYLTPGVVPDTSVSNRSTGQQ